jgi:mutator protein MutT
MKRVVAALIVKDDKLLVCQRTRHQTMPLKWEFPGGKIEEGEQPRAALRRELEEELGIHATIGDELARIQHEYPNGGANIRVKSRTASSAMCNGPSARICFRMTFSKLTINS